MDDTQLVRQLAALMGWEIGNGTQEEDYSAAHVYYDGNGEYWRGAGPNLSYGPMRPWRPLSSMDDAMMLVQKLRAAGWHYELGDHISDPNIHGAAFGRGYWDHYNHSWSESVEAAADAPARAICLAALETREEGNT